MGREPICIHKPGSARNRVTAHGQHNTATRQGTVNKQVGRSVHRPVHARAKGGQREHKAYPPTPPKIQQGRGGKPPVTSEQKTAVTGHGGGPLRPTRTSPPTRRGREGRIDSHRPGKPNKHPTKAGKPLVGQNHGQRQRDPTLGQREATPPSPATGPGQRRRTTTTTGPPPGQKIKKSGRDDIDPPPGKGRTTNHGAADTARTAGRKTEPHTRQKKTGGGYHGDQSQNRQPPMTVTSGPQHERTRSPTHRTLPPNQQQVPTGKSGRQHPQNSKRTKKAENNPHRGKDPSPQTAAAPRGRQGQTTTRIGEEPPHPTGPTTRTGEVPRSWPHKKATRPNRGNTSWRTPTNDDRHMSGQTQTGPHATRPGQQ